MRKIVLSSIVLIGLLVLSVVPAFSANTTLYADGTLTIVPDGLTDWSWRDDMDYVSAAGIVVKSIQFVPSASDDRLIIHNGGIDAVVAFDSGPTGTTPVIKYYPSTGKRIKLVIDATDCTFDTAANARIYIEYE